MKKKIKNQKKNDEVIMKLNCLEHQFYAIIAKKTKLKNTKKKCCK